jgi:hypothetical protein
MGTIIEETLFLPDRWGVEQRRDRWFGRRLGERLGSVSRLFQDEDPR